MLQGLIIANADPSVFWLNNFYLLLRFAYSGVLLMTTFLKIYPIPKIRNIPIYRLAYSIAMYCNISYRDTYRIARFLPIHSPNRESMRHQMRDTRPNNADELKATVKETWASIPPQQCHKLITSMPRRIEAVIKAKGAPTKYWVHIQ